MIILYVFILFLCLYKIKPRQHGFYDTFIDKDQCNSIKGIFILFVFVRHILQYIVKSNYGFDAPGDHMLYVLDGKIDQLIVVMFLFYSGYGISESAKKKGLPYVRSIPKNRILPTLLNFDIAVGAFIILDIILQKQLSLQTCLISLTGWDSVGNSNWYIFDILICYFMAFTAFQLASLSKGRREILTFAIDVSLTLLFIVIMSRFKPCHWYNTALSFSAGMFFSFYKERIIPLLKKYYPIALILSSTSFATLFVIHRDILSLKFNAMSIIFALIIILITMKIRIDNPPLQWLGKQLFPLYIYQRIPMIALASIGHENFVRNYPYLFIAASLIITFFISHFYKYWQISIPNKTNRK